MHLAVKPNRPIEHSMLIAKLTIFPIVPATIVECYCGVAALIEIGRTKLVQKIVLMVLPVLDLIVLAMKSFC